MPVNVLPPIIINLLLFVNTNACPDRAFGKFGIRGLENPIASAFLVLLIRDIMLEDLPVYGLVRLVLLIDPPIIKEVEFNQRDHLGWTAGRIRTRVGHVSLSNSTLPCPDALTDLQN